MTHKRFVQRCKPAATVAWGAAGRSCRESLQQNAAHSSTGPVHKPYQSWKQLQTVLAGRPLSGLTLLVPLRH